MVRDYVNDPQGTKKLESDARTAFEDVSDQPEITSLLLILARSEWRLSWIRWQQAEIGGSPQLML